MSDYFAIYKFASSGDLNDRFQNLFDIFEINLLYKKSDKLSLVLNLALKSRVPYDKIKVVFIRRYMGRNIIAQK